MPLFFVDQIYDKLLPMICSHKHKTFRWGFENLLMKVSIRCRYEMLASITDAYFVPLVFNDYTFFCGYVCTHVCDVRVRL